MTPWKNIKEQQLRNKRSGSHRRVEIDRMMVVPPPMPMLDEVRWVTTDTVAPTLETTTIGDRW